MTTNAAIIGKLSKHLRMNGTMPKNPTTDEYLSKLIGGAFDLKVDMHQDGLLKQLSVKFPQEQMLTLTTGDQGILQTLIFIIVLIRFTPRLIANNSYKKQLGNSIKALNKILKIQWNQNDYKNLADSLVF